MQVLIEEEAQSYARCHQISLAATENIHFFPKPKRECRMWDKYPERLRCDKAKHSLSHKVLSMKVRNSILISSYKVCYNGLSQHPLEAVHLNKLLHLA